MIIIKKLLILGALGASALGVGAQKADAATVKRTVNHDNGVSVFTNYENAGYTGELLRTGDEVDVYDTKTDLAGNKWIKIGEGQWITEQYTVEAGSSYGSANQYGSTGTTSQYSSNQSTGSYGSSQSASSYGSTSQYGSTQSTGSSYVSTGTTSQYSSNQSTSSYGSSSTGSSQSTSSYGSAKSTQSAKESTGSTKSTQAPRRPSGLSSSEHAAKEWIAQRESGGSYTAQNGQYYGRYQLSRSYLNGDYSSANQEKVANNYVKNRYGSWSNAKSFWQTHGWY